MALLNLREYRTIKALRRGETVDIGAGVLVKMDEGEIKPGDLYVAERNTGPKLLTCHKVNDEGGWIVPVEMAYAFDTNECVKVCEA